MREYSQQRPFSTQRYIAALAVHLFTASSAVIGLLTLYAIYDHQFITALWLMGAAILIDAADGSLARMVGVKKVMPHIDGALMDNVLDYLNYVITPCFFLLVNGSMLADGWDFIIVSLIALASVYQFTQTDAKTPDHFFKGFPSYWNIIVIYLFIFQTSMMTNTIILITLVILVFVPIKYVYPSRLDYLTEIAWLRKTMLFGSILYGVAIAGLLWFFPVTPLIFVIYSFAYIAFYLGFSLFRTYVPMLKLKRKLRESHE